MLNQQKWAEYDHGTITALLRDRALDVGIRKQICQWLYRARDPAQVRLLICVLLDPDIGNTASTLIERYLSEYCDLASADLALVLQSGRAAAGVAALQLASREWEPNSEFARVHYLVALGKYWEAAREGALAIDVLPRNIPGGISALSSIPNNRVVTALLQQIRRSSTKESAISPSWILASSLRRFLLRWPDLVSVEDLWELSCLEDLHRSPSDDPGARPARQINCSTIRRLSAAELARRGYQTAKTAGEPDIHALIDDIESHNARVRHDAIRAIGDLGVTEAMPVLIGAFNTAVERLAEAAPCADEAVIARCFAQLADLRSTRALILRLRRQGGEAEYAAEALSIILQEFWTELPAEVLGAIGNLERVVSFVTVGDVSYSYAVPIGRIREVARKAASLRQEEPSS